MRTGCARRRHDSKSLLGSPPGQAVVGKERFGVSQSAATIPDVTADVVRPVPIPGLTGLRIVGDRWVMLFHFQPTLYEAWPTLRHLASVLGIGDLGPPLFFMLSGHII